MQTNLMWPEADQWLPGEEEVWGEGLRGHKETFESDGYLTVGDSYVHLIVLMTYQIVYLKFVKFVVYCISIILQ